MLNAQLPEILALNAKGDLHVENIDVFCEKGVFNVEQTKRILEQGKRNGLRINFHGEELSCLGSAEVNKHYILTRFQHTNSDEVRIIFITLLILHLCFFRMYTILR